MQTAELVDDVIDSALRALSGDASPAALAVARGEPGRKLAAELVGEAVEKAAELDGDAEDRRDQIIEECAIHLRAAVLNAELAA